MPSHRPIYYVDESIYSNILIAALSSAGVTVQTVGTVLPFGSPDEDWLQLCGQNGWFALTRDQRIRYRTLEKEALKEYGVGCFTFTGGQATGQQMADCIVKMLPQINQKTLDARRPFLYTFGLAGRLSKLRI